MSLVLAKPFLLIAIFALDAAFLMSCPYLASLSKPSLTVRQLILLLMLTFSGVYRRARGNDKAYVEHLACSTTREFFKRH